MAPIPISLKSSSIKLFLVKKYWAIEAATIVVETGNFKH